MSDSKVINDAYKHCMYVVKSHYENFPVASKLLPKPMRKHVAAVYAFSRYADDLADEGDIKAEMRLQKLGMLETQIERTLRGEPTGEKHLVALCHTIKEKNLSTQHFKDLISAFSQDVTVNRYDTFAEVLDYCQRSAAPIGRIMLHLSNSATEENLAYSDKVCSALQLINFYQDIQQDIQENGRIYIPTEEMSAYEITPEHLINSEQPPLMPALMQFQYHRAEQLLLEGSPLGQNLKGRVGAEIRAIIHGGLKVCTKLKAQTDVYSRPRLSKGDWRTIMFKALFKR